MKKALSIIIAFMLLFAACACGNSSADGQTISGGKEDPAQSKTEEGFAFVSGSATLTPGEPFDPSLLPEPTSFYSVPSCAVEGMDNVYGYGSFQVTAFKDGEGERIYSIYFIEPNIRTPEGLGLGDDIAAADDCIKGEYASEGESRIYTRGDTRLQLISENGVITGIEYLYVIDK